MRDSEINTKWRIGVHLHIERVSLLSRQQRTVALLELVIFKFRPVKTMRHCREDASLTCCLPFRCVCRDLCVTLSQVAFGALLQRSMALMPSQLSQLLRVQVLINNSCRFAHVLLLLELPDQILLQLSFKVGLLNHGVALEPGA